MMRLGRVVMAGMLAAGCADDGAGDAGGTAASGASADGTTRGATASSGGEDTEADASSADQGSEATGDGVGQLPTPCTETTVQVVETEHEPNDTPAQAVDLCTLDVSGTWSVSGELGGEDAVDYYIFASAEGIGVVPFKLDPCWTPTMDFVLYDVTDGALELFWDGSTSDDVCEDAPGAIPTNRIYLMRIGAPEGAALPSGTTYGW